MERSSTTVHVFDTDPALYAALVSVIEARSRWVTIIIENGVRISFFAPEEES